MTISSKSHLRFTKKAEWVLISGIKEDFTIFELKAKLKSSHRKSTYKAFYKDIAATPSTYTAACKPFDG